MLHGVSSNVKRRPLTDRHSPAAPVLYALALGLLVSTAGRAQTEAPGPWVPLGSHLDQLTRWALDEGALRQVDPLNRPFRMAAIRRAVAAEDTTRLSAAGRRAMAWLAAELGSVTDSQMVGAELALQHHQNGRRDTFRPGGLRGNKFDGGIWASVARGPFVAVLNPAITDKLRDDPEYTGAKTKLVAGRMQTAYVALTGERGDLFFGRMPRDWGPGLFDGLLVSPTAYAFEALGGALRFGRLELTAFGARLEDWPASPWGSRPVARYLFAHRLAVRLGPGIWLAGVETGVYGGPGGGFSPILHNPLNLGLLSQYNDSVSANVQLGADLHARVARGLSLAASGFVDDIQVDRTVLSDHRPSSFGLTILARYALPRHPAHIALGYTRIAYLTYRNGFSPEFEYSYHRVGLGHNFSDYDQWLARVEARPSVRWYLALDLTYLRQGSGDFRQPFPNDTVLAGMGANTLVPPVHRALGARITASAEPRPGLEVRGEIGAVRRATGGAEGIFGLSVHLGADLLGRRLGSPFPGIEPGGNRAWP